MLLNETEQRILKALNNCSFLPSSYDKKIANSGMKDASPLQQWNLHRLCIRYRKQINNNALLLYSQDYMKNNPTAPLSRRESEKLIRRAKKDKKTPPPAEPTLL